MFTEFAESKNPVEMPAVMVHNVYHVTADSTYHVIRSGETGEPGIIAVRTIGGRGNIECGKNETAMLDPNTLYLIEYDKVTAYYPETDLWDFWWFKFTLSHPLPLELGKTRSFPFGEEERQQLSICLSYMQRDAPLSQLTGSAHFGAILSNWLCVQMTPHRVHEEKIADILRYIRENLERVITVEELSAMCGLSSRRFRDVFRNCTGMTPKEYILRLRMERAAFFLSNTSSAIYDIAEMTGFSDPFYFSRAFTEYFGAPPQKYRRLLLPV